MSIIHAETTQLSDLLSTTLPAHRSEWSRVARVSNLAVLPKVVEHGRGVQPFVGIGADCDAAELSSTHAELVQLSNRVVMTKPAHRSELARSSEVEVGEQVVVANLAWARQTWFEVAQHRPPNILRSARTRRVRNRCRHRRSSLRCRAGGRERDFRLFRLHQLGVGRNLGWSQLSV